MCGEDDECRDHLFFSCGYSEKVWNEVLSKFDLYYRCSTWDEEIGDAIVRFKGNSLTAKVVDWNLLWLYATFGKKGIKDYLGVAASLTSML